MNEGELLLLPAPRRVLRHEGTVRVLRDAAAHEVLVPDLPDEGCRLRCGLDEGAPLVCEARDERGLRHARRTIAQLRARFGEALPRLEIEDRPAFGERGFLLDVSRGRVPTRTERRELVDRLAALKLNRLELYTEHTFAYRGHEAVWRDADPLTADDVRELDGWCRSEGIALVANQNCFGHFENWLRHPGYAHLAETHGTFVFEGIELEGPFSLCPTDPRSLDLVRDLLAQLLPCFTSGVVNIGCDETQDVGQGRSRDAVRDRGLFDVYRDHLDAVARFALEHGFTPQFWADIALRFPDRLHELHPELVPIAWGYEPDHPFDELAAALAASGRSFLLCCGTHAWRSWIGRTTERRANLAAVLAAGRAHGASGLLIAEWGDLGHTQVEPIGRLGLAEFAARSWNPDAPVDPRAVSLHAYADEGLAVADWIAELGDLDRDLRERSGIPDEHGTPTRLRNANAVFERVHPSGFPNRVVDDPSVWNELESRLDRHLRRLATVETQLERDLRTAVGQAIDAAVGAR